MKLIDCIERSPVFGGADERGALAADVPARAAARPLADRVDPAADPAADPAIVLVRKGSYVNHSSTGAERIAGTPPPPVSSAGEPEDARLTGWTTGIAGDISGCKGASARRATRVPAVPTAAVS